MVLSYHPMSRPPNREVTLFSAALELPIDQRAAYLDEACADDPALRQRVEELLRVHQEAISFLEDNAPGIPLAPAGLEVSSAAQSRSAAAEKTGDRIGRYKLLQQIGEGGCGVVYMAEQEEPLRRRVALKVIKLGMDTKQVIARFEAERQALALMDHPNIAKVLDAGATAAGRPYFVMELVRGTRITEYCDQNNLSTEERLMLFVQVCQAIQHAHQKGIIHRDIKPSNILVTVNEPGGPGCPKIIDFGIAKATTGQALTDKTVFTAFEQFIGTPAYMSPEQATMIALDIDTRTDIYSLGVLLYELLTGKTPLDQKELVAAGLEELRRTIREKEPARPSTRLSTMLESERTTTAKHRCTDGPKLVRLVQGDLDWIVMKCLEKDRARRYATANGLAMDVQRHLSCEPVLARQPSRLYEFQKTVRRHKFGFAAAAALILVLAAGVFASTSEALRATRAEGRQRQLREQAETNAQKALLAQASETEMRRQAQANEKKAETAAAKSQQVAQLMKNMLKGVGPSKAKGRDTKMLQEILDEAVISMSKELTNQPEVEVELCLTLADTYYDLSLYQQMVDVARRGLEVARSRLGPEHESVPDCLLRLAGGLMKLSHMYLGEMMTGNVPPADRDRRLHDNNLVEAERCCLESLAMIRKSVGNEHVNVARVLNLQGNIYFTQYRLEEAEALKKAGLAMYQKLLGDEDPRVAKVLQELALLLAFREDRLAEAETMNHQALAIQRKLLGDDHPAIARSMFNLANVLRREGKWAEAETAYRESLARWQRLRVGDTSEVADALSYLAEVLLHQGKLAEAETQRREELRVWRVAIGNEQATVAGSLSRLADVLAREGKLEEADARAREGLALIRKVRGDGDPSVGEPLDTFVSVLLAQHKEREAGQLLEEFLRPTREGQPPRPMVLLVQSTFYARCRRWPEAVADLSKLVELDPTDDDDQFKLTVLSLELGDMANYHTNCQQMVARFGTAEFPGPLGKTAEACLLSGGQADGYPAAGQLADHALALGKNSYWVHDLKFIKGLAKYRAGQFQEAIDWVNQSIGQPTMVTGPRPDAPAYLVLAMAQHQLKRPEKARAALSKGLDIVNANLLQREKATLDENWVDWLIAHILLAEAQAMIEGPPRVKE
jgi:eukaryotic-like serine/threonine-protein kinase